LERVKFVIHHLLSFCKYHKKRVVFLQILSLLSIIFASANILLLIPMLQKFDSVSSMPKFDMLPNWISRYFEWVMRRNMSLLLTVILCILMIQKFIQYHYSIQREWIEIEFYHSLKKNTIIKFSIHHGVSFNRLERRGCINLFFFK